MVDLEFARSVLRTEADAIKTIVDTLDETFVAAVELMLGCQGRIVVTGMGKAHLIGRKISATLASTGTPSFDLHAGEALHGDIGRMVEGDVVLALSNSGKTREICELMDPLKRLNIPCIAITGNPHSPLGENADLVLSIGKLEEVCPLGLAPSTTTTVMLALGDALALSVQKARDFKPEDYARNHPAGELGRRLMKVREIMRSFADIPTLGPEATVKEAVKLTSSLKLRAGAVLVCEADRTLLGIFTNGDLARLLADEHDLGNKTLREVMTRGPKHTVGPEQLASEAYSTIKKNKIDDLPVVDDDKRLVGLVDVQDLLDWGPSDNEP